MRSSLLFAILVCLAPTAIQAQNNMILNYRGCGFIDGAEPSQTIISDPSNEALEYVKRICVSTGITQNFQVKQGLVANAYSTTDEANERVILYNAEFFSKLNSETYKIAILAHEIGHFLNYNIFSTGNLRAQDELDADEYAGNVIAKLGLRLEDALALVRLKCPIPAAGHYPAQSDRVEAFTKGFRNAHPMDDGTFCLNIKLLLYKIDFGSSLSDVLNYEWGNGHSNDIVYSRLPIAGECTGQDIKYYWRYLKDSKMKTEIYAYLQNNGLKSMITDDTYIVYSFEYNKLTRIGLRIYSNTSEFEKRFYQSLGQDVAIYPYRYQSEINNLHYTTGCSFTDVKSSEIGICNDEGYRICVHDWWH